MGNLYKDGVLIGVGQMPSPDDGGVNIGNPVWSGPGSQTCAVLHADGMWRCEIPVQPKEVKPMECPSDLGALWLVCGFAAGIVCSIVVAILVMICSGRLKR